MGIVCHPLQSQECVMRGAEVGQQVLFSYVAIDARIPADHPLRAMKRLLEPVLAELGPRFAAMYADGGRPSIPPEHLLRALLLQVLYTIRSERQLMEQLEYNLLFRWFVGLGMDDAIWHATTFTKNRERMVTAGLAEAFFTAVVRQADARGLLSREHFTVDGTLLEAWASQKSVRRKDEDSSGPPAAPNASGGGARGGPVGRDTPADFHGERRSNATHASVTDPDARMARKGAGKPSVLAYQASVLTDNRHGLVVATVVGHATGTAEVEQAAQMLSALSNEPGGRTGRRTVGADKLYDQQAFVAAARSLAFAPHVAQQARVRHGSRLDRRTTRHPGYAESQRRRKLVEEGFGWGKVVGLLRKLRHRGVGLVDAVFTFTMGIYNLVRIRTLTRAGVCA
jgi:transposase